MASWIWGAGSHRHSVQALYRFSLSRESLLRHRWQVGSVRAGGWGTEHVRTGCALGITGYSSLRVPGPCRPGQSHLSSLCQGNWLWSTLHHLKPRIPLRSLLHTFCIYPAILTKKLLPTSLPSPHMCLPPFGTVWTPQALLLYHHPWYPKACPSLGMLCLHMYWLLLGHSGAYILRWFQVIHYYNIRPPSAGSLPFPALPGSLRMACLPTVATSAI